MRFFSAVTRGWPLYHLLAALVAGCTPPPGSSGANQAERYLTAGNSRVQNGDFEGARGAFEQALQLDPRSVEAHNALAVLYDNESQLNVPEKALYHYYRVLELDPNFRWADVINGRLATIRMRLADSSTRRIVSPALDKEIEELQIRVGTLNQQLARMRTENEGLRSQLALCQANAPEAGQPPSSSDDGVRPSPAADPRRQASPDPAQAPRPSPQPGHVTYQFQKGDTLYSLGRRHGVPWQDILAANPGLDIHSIQPGATIRIPVK